MPPRQDKIFKKRKVRNAREHHRKMAKRDPYDMVLIVCEGEKTEPNYFNALIHEFQLNTANVRIANNTSGSSPRNVVEHALREYRKSKDYDHVFCVIDKDNHQNYIEALDIVNRARLKKGHKIHAVTSVPCFEFWLLLHYVYTTKNYYTGSGSVCQKLIDDLKAHIHNYEKGDGDIFNIVKSNTDEAIRRAESVVRYCEQGGTDNPCTKVHELVKYLKGLKTSCRP